MSDLRFSAATKALIAAAKTDTPGAAARAKMWSSVSSTLGTAGASGGAWLGATSATKLLSVAALLGGTMTVGLAATMLRLGPTPAPVQPPPAPPALAVTLPDPTPVETTPRGTQFSRGAASQDDFGAEPVALVVTSAAAPHRTRVPGGAKHSGANHEDTLGREASLVTQARAALAQGEPRAALRDIRAARALPVHQLAPEELAVEEQALRAIGRSDEANGIEVELRLEYPESALAR